MITTNRDLYRNIRGLRDEWADRQPLLEEYLRSLWMIVRDDTAGSIYEMTAERLFGWCVAALEAPPPAFDPAWLDLAPSDWYDEAGDEAGFADWEHVILWQIADLRRMADAGTLNDPYRYFGIASPSGASWYNFTPLGYLECGIRGTFGGYAEDEVTVLIPAESGSNDSPVYELPPLPWAALCQVLECGQIYE